MSGAAIGTAINPAPGSFPHVTNMMHWAAPASGTQSIEVTVENVWPTPGGDGTDGQYVMLFTNISGNGFEANFADFEFTLIGGGTIEMGLHAFDAAGNWDNNFNADFVMAPTEPVKLRFESDPDGTQRTFVNGALAATWLNDQAVTGSYVGFGTEFSSRTSPRFLEVCIGGAGDGGDNGIVCDDFERTDGPLGPPDYASPPAPLPYRYWVPCDIVSGHVEWTGYNTGTDPHPSAAELVNRRIDGDQFIELTISHLSVGITEIELYAQVPDATSATNMTGLGLYFGFNKQVDPLFNSIVIYGFNNDPYDDVTPYWGEQNPSGIPLADTQTMRLECDADGACRAFLNGSLLFAGAATFTLAPYTGFAATKWQTGSSPWIESVCVGGPGGAHKTSWVAGWRTGASSDTVAWSDVNTGPTDLQSAQAALVVDADTSGDTPDVTGGDLVIGGVDDPFTGDIFEAERREGCDPYGGDVVWRFDPSTDAAWAAFTPSDPAAVVPTTPGVAVRYGDACPQSWDEAADRSQMTTQVMIARQSPSNIPPLTYNFPGANPPAAGQIVLNAPQSEATVMRVHKTMNTGADSTLWLRYLHANDRVRFADADDTGVAVGYALTGEPAESATFFDLPIIWQDGQNPVPAGVIALTLTLLPQPPHLFYDAFGVPIYGVETLNRTDLINTSDDLLPTLADRILEVRGSNSIPRVETVTLDARTGGFNQPTVMHLMSTAAPERPSRYRMRLQVDERPIFDRVCFVNSVRHFIARDEWTVRLALDVAEWGAQSG